MSNAPKDMHGTELAEGDFVHQFLPMGCNYVAGKIIKVSHGGLAVPNSPNGEVTPGQIQVAVLLYTTFVPHGGNIGHIVKLAVKPVAPTPEETARVDNILKMHSK